MRGLETRAAHIPVTRGISLDKSEIREHFVRSSGPGGQNVNKVSTAVQLRFDVRNSAGLPPEVRDRLVRLAGKRISKDGVIVIDARRFSSQDKNREDALQRLVALVREASKRPRARKETGPTLSSKRARLEKKRLKSRQKNLRKPVLSLQE